MGSGCAELSNCGAAKQAPSRKAKSGWKLSKPRSKRLRLDALRCPHCDALFEQGRFVCYGAKSSGERHD